MFLQPKLRFDDLVLEKSVYDIAVITNHVRWKLVQQKDN